MPKRPSIAFPAAPLVAVAFAWLGPLPAVAQSVGNGGPLGGYGASSGVTDSGMGGGPMVIPYGGMTEGFMPGRMGGGSPLSFRPRPSATMGPSRAPLILSPLSGGMSSSSAGMGRGSGLRSSMLGPAASRGMGSAGARMGVMPPRIGYPFRQPPSPSTPSSGVPGMSM